MTGHVKAWLGAYHDDELRGDRLLAVEAHLAECAACRRELETLQQLAAVLQEYRLAETVTEPVRFAAAVEMRLSRYQQRSAIRSKLEVGWQLVPLGMIGVWAFGEAVFNVGSIILLLLQMGPQSELATWLLQALPRQGWLVPTFGGEGPSIDSVLSGLLEFVSGRGLLGSMNATSLVFLILIDLLYLGWLASWWALRQRRIANSRTPAF